MKSINISIPEAEYERLALLAEREGVSPNELAAAGVQEILSQKLKQPYDYTPEQIVEIEAGLADLAAGNTTPHADVVREIEKYLEE